MRAFFCIELDSGTKEQIAKIISKLKRADIKAAWIRPENLHITVRFLGDVDDGLIPQLRDLSAGALSASADLKNFDCPFDQIGAFPSQARPRVIWVGCRQEPAELGAIAQRLEAGLAPMGFEAERNSFVTHVTLARIKEPSTRTGQILNEALSKMDRFSIPASLRGLTLMKSELTPTGSIYTPVFRVNFPA